MSAKLKIILAFISFGTIGIVSSYIPLSSQALVFYRALIGALFIIFFSFCIHRKYNFLIIKKYLPILTLSGIFMGINWVLQFMAMRNASVSVAVICYNTMPIFVLILSPILFKEKLNIKNFICIILSMIGVIFVSDVINVGFKIEELIGVIYGVSSAVFYALTVCITKKLKEVDVYDKVTYQFIIVAILFFIIIMFNKNDSFLFGVTDDLPLAIIMFLLLTIFITGYMYIVYFDSVDKLPAKTIAILTYIDPMVAIILSFLVLNETLTPMKVIGALLILLSTIINEFINI